MGYPKGDIFIWNFLKQFAGSYLMYFGRSEYYEFSQVFTLKKKSHSKLLYSITFWSSLSSTSSFKLCVLK